MDKVLEFYTKTLELFLQSKSENWFEVGREGNNFFIGLYVCKKESTLTIVPYLLVGSFRVKEMYTTTYFSLKQKNICFIKDIGIWL